MGHSRLMLAACHRCGFRRTLSLREKNEGNTLDDSSAHMPYAFERVRRRTEHQRYQTHPLHVAHQRCIDLTLCTPARGAAKSRVLAQLSGIDPGRNMDLRGGTSDSSDSKCSTGHREYHEEVMSSSRGAQVARSRSGARSDAPCGWSLLEILA